MSNIIPVNPRAFKGPLTLVSFNMGEVTLEYRGYKDRTENHDYIIEKGLAIRVYENDAVLNPHCWIMDTFASVYNHKTKTIFHGEAVKVPIIHCGVGIGYLAKTDDVLKVGHTEYPVIDYQAKFIVEAPVSADQLAPTDKK